MPPLSLRAAIAAAIIFAIGPVPTTVGASNIRPNLSMNLGYGDVGATRAFERINPGFGPGITIQQGRPGPALAGDGGAYSNPHGNNPATVISTAIREAPDFGRSTTLLPA